MGDERKGPAPIVEPEGAKPNIALAERLKDLLKMENVAANLSPRMLPSIRHSIYVAYCDLRNDGGGEEAKKIIAADNDQPSQILTAEQIRILNKWVNFIEEIQPDLRSARDTKLAKSSAAARA